MNRLAFGLLWLFVFSHPWENVRVAAGIGSVPRLIGLLMIVVSVMVIAGSGKMRRPGPAQWMLLVFVIYAGLSSFWTIDPETTATKVTKMIQILCMFWLIWELAETVARQWSLLQAYLLGACVSIVQVIINYKTGNMESRLGDRITANNYDPNDLGLVAALGIPIAWYLADKHRGTWMEWLYRLYVPAALLAIVLTGSRGSFLAAIAALGYILLTFQRLRFLHRFAVGLSVVVIVLSAPFLVPKEATDRLSTIPEELTRGTMSGRRNLWRASYEAFLERPYFGVGWGGHTKVKLKYSRLDEGKVAHNVYLSVLTETGVVGFILYFSVIGICLAGVRSLPPTERILWIILLITWGIGASSLTWDVRKVSWILFGIMSAQTSVTRIHESRLGRRQNSREPNAAARVTIAQA